MCRFYCGEKVSQDLLTQENFNTIVHFGDFRYKENCAPWVVHDAFMEVKKQSDIDNNVAAIKERITQRNTAFLMGAHPKVGIASTVKFSKMIKTFVILIISQLKF